MKARQKRILSMVLAGVIFVTSPMAVFATDANAVEESTMEAEESNTNSDLNGSVTTAPENQASAEETTPEATPETTPETTGDEVVIEADDKPYLALGADLTEEQRNSVLGMMGIDPANLAEYDVVYVNNQEEHEYLGEYIDAKTIGKRSLSSVLIVKRDAGNGLNIATNNINYCTVGMYKNALTTAGITDADIIVAGPISISGTAALVGIFKAYNEVAGEEIQEDVIDTALHELVVTGKLENSIQGLTNEQVEEFMAYVKSVIAENGLKDEASIRQALQDACQKYGITLSEEEMKQIMDLLLKISSLDIDLGALVDYASSLYDSFKNSENAAGMLEKVGNFLSSFFEKLIEFFKNLF